MKTLTFLFLTLICFNVKSQSFQNVLGGAAVEQINSIVNLSGGDHIVCGFNFNSSVVGGINILVARITNRGAVVWQNIYGGLGVDMAFSSVVKPNGNIVVACTSSSFNSTGKLDLLLIEINPNGAIIWSVSYPGAADMDEIPSKINLSPNGLVICGSIGVPNTDSPDFLVLEVSRNGQQVFWQNRIGISAGYGDIAADIIPSINGGFILVGGTYALHTIYDQVVMRLNNSGKIVSSIVFGSDLNENAESVIELANGDLAVMGNFRSLSGPGLEYALTKIKPNNTIDWIRTYGDNGSGDERAYGFTRNNNGEYAISGYSNILRGHGDDILQVITDEDGNMIRSSIFGNSNNERPTSMVVNADGSYSIVGNSVPSNNIDGFLFRTNTNGELGSNCYSALIHQNNRVLDTRNNIYSQSSSGLYSIPFNGVVSLTTTLPSRGLNCPVLPVDLVYFNGYTEADAVLLKWSTTKEYNNLGFEIERSYDSYNWEVINKVSSNGNKDVTQNYSAIDLDFDHSYSTLYYRLKQYDYNGDFVYYKSISVENLLSIALKQGCIYPNPVENIVNIKKFVFVDAHCDVLIRDVIGNIVRSEEFSIEQQANDLLTIDVTGLSRGLYFITITSKTDSFTQQFIKK